MNVSDSSKESYELSSSFVSKLLQIDAPKTSQIYNLQTELKQLKPCKKMSKRILILPFGQYMFS